MEMDPPPQGRTLWFLTAAMIVLGPLAVTAGIAGPAVAPNAVTGTTLGGVVDVVRGAVMTLTQFPDEVRAGGLLSALTSLLGLLPLAVLLMALRATLALGEESGGAGEAGEGWRWAVATHAVVVLAGPVPVFASVGALAIMALAAWALYILLRDRMVDPRV